MQNKSLVIAVASMDFLTAAEKINCLKALQDLEDGGKGLGLSFLEKSSFGQVESLAFRNKSRPYRLRRWNGGELVRRARGSALLCGALGIECVLYGQKNYPKPLLEICDPPFALFYRGNIEALDGKNLAIVGTRRLSSDGREAARTFAYDAASSDFCVVSGLAMGADGQAHQGAIDAFYDKKSGACKTAAVLAGGVDNIFPSAHKKMAAQIMRNGGLVLSECPPGVPAEKWRFVQRNRIIAALSKATVVVQAPPGSGAMITADFALGYNKEVFFHQACFSPKARTLSDLVKKNLEATPGSQARRKIEASPEAFVRDGAQVVKSFSDFALRLFP